MGTEFRFRLDMAVARYRPAPRQTDCHNGFSVWHLVALGLFDHFVEEFAQTVWEVPINDLIWDLQESTWKRLPLPFYGPLFERRHGIPLARVNHLFLYRSVKELCEMMGTPLFGYWDISHVQIHPVVETFNACLDLPKEWRGQGAD